MNPISVENWNIFYKSFYCEPVDKSNVMYLDTVHPYLDQPVTMSELVLVLKGLKNNKSPGPDKIKNEFYKNLPTEGKQYLLKIVNNVLIKEDVPKKWAQIEMILVHKKGDKMEPSNYRNIALLNTITKIVTQILGNRLTNWSEANHVLIEAQSGFRRGRGCNDNIFVLNSLVYMQLRLRRGKLYTVFVDLKRAFDTIKHTLVWKKLFDIGVSGKLIRIIRNLYVQAEMKVRVNNGQYVQDIGVTKGVLQGDSLSPLLFSLFMNDNESYFRKHGCRGVNIDGMNDVILLTTWLFSQTLLLILIEKLSFLKIIVTKII